jgi:hypothetical protein
MWICCFLVSHTLFYCIQARTARLDFITGWTVSETGRIIQSDLVLLSKGKTAVGTNLRSKADCLLVCVRILICVLVICLVS